MCSPTGAERGGVSGEEQLARDGGCELGKLVYSASSRDYLGRIERALAEASRSLLELLLNRFHLLERFK